ncbi:WD repeat, SAM and U-box domain-containing protein 1 isoform X1 [Loxodonta africana]|uniref:WD repeat, SAM and U-box domain-containing protein 1 n=2 Tax=Elephantidae TaxID=9780 RepID=G3T4F7_LOXAF|nr:WD repeat, SAM and U-box domain-containing protein 1 isoform X1 [Loxodonta africana]XP_010584595.1 WD repeat, SAM and U-box domain-containing protein 1 isoform X1 [Loxodonta africana]XP_010584596.1 WD repeat, SAM and U-box domain-containing protein 1 isoform X1 [Loxodonta africana]XP_023398688.1 WD repeat, SAM and U-box domain-containing protein 1 isoform X1 [Loxodonta africana]XP_023398689.1 WD repeat, SAM and U-box domain-containing protein 1 isoform X1 [Loxodonta africana]XP_023398690.1 
MVKLIHTLADHGDDVNCCAFSSSLLATCSLDKTIRLYSLSDFSELPHSPLKFHTYAVHWCCFSPSGHLLASCSTDGTTVLWNMQNGQTLAVMEQPSGSPVRVCRFSPDSTCLVSGAADGTVVLWNTQSYKLHRCGSVKDGSLVACAFSPSGDLFVTGSSCGDLTVWDDKMRCLHSEKAHDLGITCCDFSSQPVSDGAQDLQFFRLASCGQDCQIKIWIVSFSHILGFELKYKSTLSGHCAPVLACAFSHDGQMLVSGSVDKSIIVYDANTENILHTLTQHTRYVTTCAFAPNTLLLATGSMDKTVNIWQFDTEALCQARGTEDQLEQFTEDWSEEDVSVWLCEQGLKDLVGIFKMNNIDGKELLNLTKESLADDLKIESLGLRSKVLRKIEELRTKVKSLSSGIPDEFICPITRELMKEPVIASDGYSYEKEAMENWIGKKKRTSPMTNLILPSVVLTPNRTLKMAIDRWLETHQK